MKGNDLSNQSAPCIAFRVEDFLVEPRDNTILDKVKRVLSVETKIEFNQRVLSALNYIYRHTDFSSILILDKKEEWLVPLLYSENIPFMDIHIITKPVEVATRLNTNILSYYVDDSEVRRSEVGHRYCITLSELETLIQAHNKRR